MRRRARKNEEGRRRRGGGKALLTCLGRRLNANGSSEYMAEHLHSAAQCPQRPRLIGMTRRVDRSGPCVITEWSERLCLLGFGEVRCRCQVCALPSEQKEGAHETKRPPSWSNLTIFCLLLTNLANAKSGKTSCSQNLAVFGGGILGTTDKVYLEQGF